MPAVIEETGAVTARATALHMAIRRALFQAMIANWAPASAPSREWRLDRRNASR